MMWTNFKLYHKSPSLDEGWDVPAGAWHLKTCLRSLVIQEGSEPLSMLNSWDVYHGQEAYEFLLQVICGLHSPLIGETEILGQFKEFVKNHRDQWNGETLSLMDRVLKDCKAIRTEYLQNLGCTSYGSLLRKRLRGHEGTTHVVGAGSLVLDVLPWIVKNQNPVEVFTRSPQKHAKNLSQYKLSYFGTLDDLKKRETAEYLVIAAPLSAIQIDEMTNLKNYKVIFDLRGESVNDPLPVSTVIPLATLFADIESNRQQAQNIKNQALIEIQKSARQMSLLEKQRPFGWEDLWSYA